MFLSIGIQSVVAASFLLAGEALALSRSENSPFSCPRIPSPYPTWQELPRQSTMPDPFLPLRYTTIDNAGHLSETTFAQEVMSGNGRHRVQTKEEWYRCRQPEILNMLQEYQYGYYPDHSKEHVIAKRDGDTVNISVTAFGKTGNFVATLSFPNNTNARKKAPAVINIGGMLNQPYLDAGIAIVQFDYTSVASDSNNKTGAFWDIYDGRDIGVLTAWAWGFHRVLDAVTMTVPEIDPSRIGVTGCSRLGKAAMAAGIFDTRIALTMPMSSGVQGLGPYRYHNMSGQDETLENSKAGAPWWSDSTLGTFVNHSQHLPYDAHTIAAALAPRALIIDQGTGDLFTNSKATALIVYPAAKAVYDWLGVGHLIGMSVRSGPHCDLSGYTEVLPFVESILLGTPTTKDYNNLTAYGTPALSSAFPWATAAPPQGKKYFES
ncbi:carbohydrate esterase family 15 protein [Xylogone sp. PMI_703]|nr:carbohydrate esterase family 15 protein [Xylogone sp. PMI_703]